VTWPGVGAWSVEQVRAAEDATMAELPDGLLMQRAATALAVHCGRLLRTVYGAGVVLLVGAGNNGGDALYAGARLAGRGARVTAVLLAPDRAHSGGLAALRAAGGRVLVATDGPAGGTAAGADPVGGDRAGASPAVSAVAGGSGGHAGPSTGDPAGGDQAGAVSVPSAGAGRSGGASTSGAVNAAALDAVRTADLVLDGIIGIGGSGGLRPAAAELVAAAAGLRVAVDVPSGVATDTGAVDGAAFRADVTVTFGCLKPGLLVGAGAEHAGEVRLADIGLAHLPEPAVRVLEHADVAALLPTAGPGDDKYTRGVVGVVAGSTAYPGAAVLCTGSATLGGAGMVRYAGTATDAVRARWPEVIVSEGGPGQAGRVQAWVVGPGGGTDDDAADRLRTVLASDLPVLVDADGITLLAADLDLVRKRSAPTVLTPHDREFERLAGPVGADRIGAARRAAADLGAIMLLKGNRTIVAGPDGTAYVNRTGTAWLATAGSGDVLSGLGGTLLAAGLDPLLAAATAAHLHGLAGQLASDGAPTTAGAVLAALPTALRAAHRPA
jgi:ADP-dependent NAD(P)H-hydrate dehydratase / NAD(P)H-hydrate epimerase